MEFGHIVVEYFDRFVENWLVVGLAAVVGQIS
jgi:hypothetical protein